MTDTHDLPPEPDSPPRNAYGRPVHRRGAARSDAVPRMENVRVTAPDLHAAPRWKRPAGGW